MRLFVGTPSDVTDSLQEWFEEACDRFVVAAIHIPCAYEDFMRLVVPELQRRGVSSTATGNGENDAAALTHSHSHIIC